LLETKQSVKDAEARASASEKELALTQQKLKELEKETPKCDHSGLEGKIRGLEEQLERRAPDQIELARDLEDTQEQLEVMRKLAEEYREPVTRILKLMEGRTGGEGQHNEREEKGSEIARLSGEDRKELRG
jgi:uncharacterized protein YbaP (TraB family)